MQKSANRITDLWPVTARSKAGAGGSLKHFMLVMKLTAFLLLATLLHVHAGCYSQSVSFSGKEAGLKTIFRVIEAQTGYVVFYNKALLQNTRNVTVDADNMPLKAFLDDIFDGQSLKYRIDGRNIVLSRKPQQTLFETVSVAVDLPITITGHIGDFTGVPLLGATVMVKGKKSVFAITDAKGAYSIKCTPGDVLVFSFVGYRSREVSVNESTELNIMLEKEERNIKDVIVTGMMVRKKESFTGATSSFTGEQLRTLGNQNILQGLKALDPALLQIENNLAGSNPNVLPTMELRGQTSISSSQLRDQFTTDPNQPLFILNGFETTLRTIIDLDINLVASVTILKDASSTAIYGSRASNGVIVVETKKPTPGKIQVSYSADLMTELPDLSSYNLMNASEKLQFEKLAGAYKAPNNSDEIQLILDSVYNNRLKNVLRGVNTYWLDKPLQTGFRQRHAINAMGGDEKLQYEIGANYRSNKGVMLGSGRNDWGVTLNMFYNTAKVRYANRAYVSGYDLSNSPYGSFSTWAGTNPYYEKSSSDELYLETVQTSNSSTNSYAFNPYFNATLASFDKGRSVTMQDNMQINVDLNNELRIQANGQLIKETTESMVFVSPLNSKYRQQADPALRGSYTYGNVSPFSYNANISITYAKLFAERHSFTAYARAEAAEQRSKMNGYTAVGFPKASNGNPAFAYGFAPGSTPAANTSLSRRNTVLASINYSYDKRYNVDLNANLDGSTAFGSNKRYQPYYSLGVSWNLHNETFLKQYTWIDNLRLRGNFGLTGNQNFGSVSQAVYSYYSSVNSMGTGLYLSDLGTPNLEWQSTRQTSVGIDAILLKNKLNLQINAFEKITDPLVVPVTLPSSVGVENYPFNAGISTVKGWEIMATYYPVYQPGKVVWSLGLTGSGLTQRYSSFGEKLNSLNKELRASNALIRYTDGYSSYDIWAVQSLGIDPATGKELFLTKEGKQTFTYNQADQVVVGSSKPVAEGVFSTTINWKGLRASAYFRYVWNRNQFNTALYNKVENISFSSLATNQDKRALYDRWQKPGDRASFKGIDITSTTPMSSRFVQTENAFSGESFNLGYEFRGKQWLNNLSLASLSLNAYTNDLFYWSNVTRERGLDYPFTRSVSLSIKATFK